MTFDKSTTHDAKKPYIKGNATVQDTQEEQKETLPAELPGPKGIGMAVAFDWGLAAQIFFTPILVTIFNQSNPIAIPGVNPTLNKVLLYVITWPVACIPAYFGEMVRRGRNWTRRIQVGINVLLSLAGIVGLINLYQSLKGGNFWPLATEVILVIFSPLIAWRLSRPATAHWFKHVTVAEASRRHGGKWVWFIVVWGAVGGILQALAASKR
jgi:hypothetical protein